MLLTAKLNLMSGMVIGAAAVMVMKQVCKRKQRKKHQETLHPLLRLTNTLKAAGKAVAQE